MKAEDIVLIVETSIIIILAAVFIYRLEKHMKDIKRSQPGIEMRDMSSTGNPTSTTMLSPKRKTGKKSKK